MLSKLYCLTHESSLNVALTITSWLVTDVMLAFATGLLGATLSMNETTTSFSVTLPAASVTLNLYVPLVVTV